MDLTFNEKVKMWYELTSEIKGIAIRDKHRDMIEEISSQVKDDFLMFDGDGNEIE